jgi:hypothetical protein
MEAEGLVGRPFGNVSKEDQAREHATLVSVSNRRAGLVARISARRWSGGGS